jgi:phosphotransferase system enzyme I (PtsP)
MGVRTLSMRPASIGPVKSVLRRLDLNEVTAVIDEAAARGAQSVRADLIAYLANHGMIA